MSSCHGAKISVSSGKYYCLCSSKHQISGNALHGVGHNYVTDDLTAQQLSYATQGICQATDGCTLTGEGADVSTSVTIGARVELGLSCFYADAADPQTIRCEIRDIDGNLLAEPSVSCAESVVYTANFSDVGARQMRKLICITFFDGETAISKTLTWSIESFVAQTRQTGTGAQVDMVNAMLIYGDSVGAYLTAIGQ